MCNIGQAISRVMTPPGTGGVLALQSEAQASQANANASLTQAINDATQASLPVLDNPSAAAANQAQMRKVMAAQGAGWSLGATPTAAPATATRILFGA
jgi:hypothetical protein